MTQEDYRLAMCHGAITEGEYVDLLVKHDMWDERFAQALMSRGTRLPALDSPKSEPFPFFDPSSGMIW